MRFVGASIRGPAHAREKRLNEDAWCARIGASGALAVVCDGMGSRSAARIGAKAAVAAVRRAWNHWHRAPRGTAEDFIRLIEVLWRFELGTTRAEDAATTCLVCALRADESGVLLQLGDGIVGTRCANGTFVPLTPERSGFASSTIALGTLHALRDWQMLEFRSIEPGTAFLLATDGISDDLVPERRPGFVTWIIDEIAANPSPNRQMATALRKWPVPHHRDDKTLIVVWKP